MVRALIVDDSLFIRTQLRDILTEGGHDVVGEAEDGSSAPELVRTLHPDVVTLDLIMPGRNGLATLGHLLQLDPSLVVIVCSASLDEARVIEALRRGARGFIVKPFDRRSVLDAVREAVGPAGSTAVPSEPNVRAAASGSWTYNESAPRRDLVNPAFGLYAGLSGEAREILEAAVANHGVTLEQILGLQCQPSQGSLIERLGWLCDMGRGPGGGFDPLTFDTSYDPGAQRRLTTPIDAMLAAEPWLTFTLPLDPNTNAPADVDTVTRNRSPDLVHNGSWNPAKRYFLDSAPLRAAPQLELAAELPACERRPAPVPLFVLKQRWGVGTMGRNPVRMGWNPVRL